VAIAPVVLVTDNIYLGANDHGDFKVTLTAADGRTRTITEPATQDNASGKSFGFAALPELRASDGVYQLDVAVVDNAGQTETAAAAFMVNRFGSVYMFDSATQQMVEAANPLQDARDIAITEVNVSPLEEREVKTIHNGQDTKILSDSEVKVTEGSEHGWNTMTYSMPASLFEAEGTYEVRLWTKDALGNVSQNDEPRDDAEDAPLIECGDAQWATLIDGCAEGAAISFRIDKTPPTITVADLKEGGKYEVASLPVTFEVTDFFEDNIASVGVQVNGADVPATNTGGDTWEVTVPNAFRSQSVVFTAVDKSGRESVREIGDVLVTNNGWAIWFNNTPLFIGSIIGAAVAVFGAMWLIILFRRRRRDGKERSGATA
jgi:hypothetical protein